MILFVSVSALAVGAQASNMGHTPHVRYALQNLDDAKKQVESAKTDGTAELETLRKRSLEFIQKAEEQLELLQQYRASHGLRDE